MKKKLLLLTILITLAFWLFPAPKAQAIDPVTIALLTPVALKVAEAARPYIMKGLAGGIKGLIDCGKDVIDIFRLPLGVLQSTVGMPFGYFGSGVRNVVLGGIAPFKLVCHTLILPIKFTGLTM
ncbi:hypothetical protein P0136_04645 [Lentisphaerota bacterium ZTH]|nr:hypothetical protein JYG24_04235 [Lentisphaerota bacterium]WET07281.1 hypothetical protein P0136_04645 [Lentisphaerota bacterium ZTH]